MDASTADGGSGPAAVELTSLATVAAAAPSTETAPVNEVRSRADESRCLVAVELTCLATARTPNPAT